MTAYQASGNEVALFQKAYEQHLPVMLTGPTGCGKTRLVEHMAELLDRRLFSVACHEDLSAADLVGRYLLKGGETQWEDGPLARAVREGGICYLDEIVEARADTTVVLHPLADHRRELHLDRLGHESEAPGHATSLPTASRGMPAPGPRLHWDSRAAVTPGSIFCRCERLRAERRSAARHHFPPLVRTQVSDSRRHSAAQAVRSDA